MIFGQSKRKKGLLRDVCVGMTSGFCFYAIPGWELNWDAWGLGGECDLRVVTLRAVVKDAYAHLCPRNFSVFPVFKGDTDWGVGNERVNMIDQQEITIESPARMLWKTQNFKN